jgi:hypothetical protein
MSSSQARDLTNVDAACLLERSIEAVRDQFAADVSGELVEAGPVTRVGRDRPRWRSTGCGLAWPGCSQIEPLRVNSHAVLDQCSVPVVVVRGFGRRGLSGRLTWAGLAMSRLAEPFTLNADRENDYVAGVCGSALLVTGRPVDIAFATPADLDRVRVF